MRQTLATATVTVLSLSAAAACGDDGPATNIDPPSTNTTGAGSVASTGATDGNVGVITASTPVGAGDDSVVQGDQPMLSSAVD